MPRIPIELRMFLEFSKDEVEAARIEGRPVSKITFGEYYKNLLNIAYHSGQMSKQNKTKRMVELYRFCHKQHLIDKAKEYNLAHPEMIRDDWRRYHKRHRRKRNSDSRLYYALNKDRILQQKKEHKQRKKEEAKMIKKVFFSASTQHIVYTDL